MGGIIVHCEPYYSCAAVCSGNIATTGLARQTMFLSRCIVVRYGVRLHQAFPLPADGEHNSTRFDPYEFHVRIGVRYHHELSFRDKIRVCGALRTPDSTSAKTNTKYAELNCIRAISSIQQIFWFQFRYVQGFSTSEDVGIK